MANFTSRSLWNFVAAVLLLLTLNTQAQNTLDNVGLTSAKPAATATINYVSSNRLVVASTTVTMSTKH